jgi:hypothetical protein
MGAKRVRPGGSKKVRSARGGVTRRAEDGKVHPNSIEDPLLEIREAERDLVKREYANFRVDASAQLANAVASLVVFFGVLSLPLLFLNPSIRSLPLAVTWAVGGVLGVSHYFRRRHARTGVSLLIALMFTSLGIVILFV